MASCRIWDALGFKRIGRIKECGNLRSHPEALVDAIIYGRDLGPEGEDFVSEERFDKIRFYLKHGAYPSGADRAEKSRLRSAATHYKLLPTEDGEGERLMLKDKEVVSDPQRQYEISRNVHAQQHGGINKTTATIAEKFHWVRIKETVSLVIKNCPDCQASAAKAPTVRTTSDNNGSGVSQLKRAANASNQSDPNSMIERLVNFDHIEPQPPRQTAQSRSPNEQSHPAPTRDMRPVQQYGDIPLDPQIMGGGQQYNRAHPASRYTNTISGEGLNVGDTTTIDPQPKSEDENQHHADTRMATERHVRQGDDPMAFQDAQGTIHDVRIQDGERGTESVDIEEFLHRS